MKTKLASVLSFASVLIMSTSAFAAERIFQPQIKADGTSGVKFSIGYSAGVHKGTASEIKGEVVLDENDKLLRAHFEVPIASMATGNSTRDCHMRESLGIDYSKSQFPKDHVCDEDNKTPASGPDSIVYPNIVLDFVNYKVAPATPLPEGAAVEAVLEAKFNIHGQVREVAELPVKIQKVKVGEKTGFKVTVKSSLSIKDYGIIVKPFKLGPVEIGVQDKAVIDLDLLLTEK